MNKHKPGTVLVGLLLSSFTLQIGFELALQHRDVILAVIGTTNALKIDDDDKCTVK